MLLVDGLADRLKWLSNFYRKGLIMAKTALQRLIEKNTGVSRFTSGAASKNKKNIKNAARRKSRGGQGG